MSGIRWSKFFWSDWEKDPALRLCSLGAQGLWMRMLCIAASHDPIGYVSVAGRRLEIPDLARYVGTDESEIGALLGELDRNGVFSRDRRGRIYSRRMIRDAKKAATARKNGLLGARVSIENRGRISALPRGSPRGSPDQNPGFFLKEESKRVADEVEKKERDRGSARAREDDWPADFAARFWAKYPHKIGKKDAIDRLSRLRKRGEVTWGELWAGLERYVNKTDDRPWCNPSTWLNQHRWADDPAQGNGTNGQRFSGNNRAASGANSFFAGIAEVAADIAGDRPSSEPEREDIPPGRFNFDG